MKALFATLVCVALTATTLPLTGCSKATAADASTTSGGRSCTVQFRRDALGAASNLPISPRTTVISGAYTTISGTFNSRREDWVVIDCGRKEVWVPRDVILLIEFE